ncbi:GxxExxY protein [Niabella ginsenosidivorans]|uniref:GxxExxY protein n=1 Tax=Niabella ginsenosidivorans TaxID=1176587 RepID=UPI0021CD5E41|nr:GxxExxY protein [Niabella ginsenosidivorans]
MYQLTEKEQHLCKEIVDCIFRVHTSLSPGLPEKIYEVCICDELEKKGINYLRQAYLSISYDGLLFDEELRMDIFIEDLIICELKAVDIVNPCLGDTNPQSFKINR